jgi:hypothetical protein
MARCSTRRQVGETDRAFQNRLVMPDLVPGIHVLAGPDKKDVDGRNEPGHDDKEKRFLDSSNGRI